MQTKKWYQSKMVWLGVIQTLIGSLEVISQGIDSGLDEKGVVNIVLGVLTVILRVWFTETPIGSTDNGATMK